MAGWLDGPVFQVLEKGLEASDIRQRVLANNVANVDTPDFKRSDVDFEAVFNAMLDEEKILPLKMTVPKHLPGAVRDNGLGIVTDDTVSLRIDNNNVDIDREMANVAENGYYHNSLTRAISDQLGLFRTVLK